MISQQGAANDLLDEEYRPASQYVSGKGIVDQMENDVDEATWTVRLLFSFFKYGFERQKDNLNKLQNIFSVLKKIDEGYCTLKRHIETYKEDGEFFMIVTGHDYQWWTGPEFDIPLIKEWRGNRPYTQRLSMEDIKTCFSQRSAYNQLQQLNKELDRIIHSLHYFMWVPLLGNNRDQDY